MKSRCILIRRFIYSAVGLASAQVRTKWDSASSASFAIALKHLCGEGEGRKGFRGDCFPMAVCCWKVGSAGSWIVDETIRLPNGAPATPYYQLTLVECEGISLMHYSEARASAIAKRLGRSPSTVGRELRRNSDASGDRAVAAQEQTGGRRRERSLIRKMDDPLINESVRTGLSQEWSPEQIAGRVKRDHPRTRGNRLVVRNGFLPEREIATGIGKVPVKQPRVRDKRPPEQRKTALPLSRGCVYPTSVL